MIHATAIVDRRAEIDTDVDVGPYSVIGPFVRIGAGCRLVSHVVVDGPTIIGRENTIFPFAVVGGLAQHKADPGTRGRLILGDHNVIREHVTIHRGTGDGTTRIGSRNMFMTASHVAHDASVGDGCTLANGVLLAGHVEVEDHVTFGGLAAVAQHVRIGESAFVAGGAMAERDVPRFVIVQGDRARVRALNRVGLERREVPEASIRALAQAFRAHFVAKLSREDALARCDTEDRFVARFLESLGRSTCR